MAKRKRTPEQRAKAEKNEQRPTVQRRRAQEAHRKHQRKLRKQSEGKK